MAQIPILVFATIAWLKNSMPATQANVINPGRSRLAIKNISVESTITANARRKSFEAAVGGFLGGQMFDYFLTRFEI